MATLRDSVGAGAANRPEDVSAVQRLLQSAGFALDAIDGVCGAQTISAIKQFQSRFLAQPDGRVDPSGSTWLKLTANATGPAPAPAGETDWSGDSSKWTQEKKLLSLEPSFRAKVQTVLGALLGNGFQPSIAYGWRSVAVQQQLVAEGKSKVKFSFHNSQLPDGTPYSYAADIVDTRWGWSDAAAENGYWEALGAVAKTAGLVWGGDWKTFPDVAHVQGRQNSELAAVRRESGLGGDTG
jgi:peptidoglycan L-alanyl-D-glutamate endopeptidase CwlK